MSAYEMVALSIIAIMCTVLPYAVILIVIYMYVVLWFCTMTTIWNLLTLCSEYVLPDV